MNHPPRAVPPIAPVNHAVLVPSVAPPSSLRVTLPLLGAILLVLALPLEGRYDLEWLIEVLVVFFVLLTVMLSVERLARRSWFDDAAAPVQVVSALGTALFVSAFVVLGVWFIEPSWLAEQGRPAPRFFEAAGLTLATGVSSYACWVMAFRYPELLRQAYLRSLETERLRLQADELERQARLAPHFLLNSLNTIAALIGRDPAKARDVIGSLGDLLRVSLYDEGASDHTLGEELVFLESYAAIMRARYGDRLVFELETDPSVRRHPLPKLLLQPLLENAVKHGALPSRFSRPIRLEVNGRNESLRIRITNPCPNELPAEPRPGGEGLRVVRERLALLNPPGSFEQSREGDLFVVEILIP